jgi:hypothetical protein
MAMAAVKDNYLERYRFRGRREHIFELLQHIPSYNRKRQCISVVTKQIKGELTFLLCRGGVRLCSVCLILGLTLRASLAFLAKLPNHCHDNFAKCIFVIFVGQRYLVFLHRQYRASFSHLIFSFVPAKRVLRKNYQANIYSLMSIRKRNISNFEYRISFSYMFGCRRSYRDQSTDTRNSAG